MYLDDMRKLDYTERTHKDTGRTCKLYAKKPGSQIDSNPSVSANHYTTVPPNNTN